VKGSVYQRGSTWYYKFHGPDKDTSTGDYPWITKGGFDRVDRPIAAESTGHRPAQSPKTVGPDRSSVLGFSLCDNGVGCFEAPVRTWRFRSIPDHWRWIHVDRKRAFCGALRRRHPFRWHPRAGHHKLGPSKLPCSLTTNARVDAGLQGQPYPSVTLHSSRGFASILPTTATAGIHSAAWLFCGIRARRAL